MCAQDLALMECFLYGGICWSIFQALRKRPFSTCVILGLDRAQCCNDLLRFGEVGLGKELIVESIAGYV